MKSAFEDTASIEGVSVRRPVRHEDSRGYLTEFFRRDETSRELLPAMGYLSVTNPGLSRGPHEHGEQTDTFFFPGPGDFVLALWDNRRGSPTFRGRMIVEAGAKSPAVVVVPPGVVHAYACASSSPGLVVNIPNRLYRGEGKKEEVDETRHETDPNDPFSVDFKLVLEGRLP